MDARVFGPMAMDSLVVDPQRTAPAPKGSVNPSFVSVLATGRQSDRVPRSARREKTAGGATDGAPEKASDTEEYTPPGFFCPELQGEPRQPSTLDAPSRGVDIEAISRQLLRSVQVQREGGQTRLRICLDGPGHGKLDLELRMESGRVQASFCAAEAAAYRALDQSRQALREALTQSGVQVGHIALELQQQGSGRHGTPNHESEPPGGFAGRCPGRQPRAGEHRGDGTSYVA